MTVYRHGFFTCRLPDPAVKYLDKLVARAREHEGAKGRGRFALGRSTVIANILLRMLRAEVKGDDMQEFEGGEHD